MTALDFVSMFEKGGIWPLFIGTMGVVALAMAWTTFLKATAMRRGEPAPALKRWSTWTLVAAAAPALLGYAGYSLGMSHIDAIVAATGLDAEAAANVRAGAETIAEPMLVFGLLFTVLPVVVGIFGMFTASHSQHRKP